MCSCVDQYLIERLPEELSADRLQTVAVVHITFEANESSSTALKVLHSCPNWIILSDYNINRFCFFVYESVLVNIAVQFWTKTSRPDRTQREDSQILKEQILYEGIELVLQPQRYYSNIKWHISWNLPHVLTVKVRQNESRKYVLNLFANATMPHATTTYIKINERVKQSKTKTLGFTSQ